MPETTPTSKPPSQAEVHHPTTVGSSFMRQYYHLLAKEPASLHRFYKDESTWCHGVGSHMQDAISGQKAINDEILRRGYAGARVDLDIGSIDCQPSLHGGVFVLVTGVMTLASSVVPKPFVQTFFLAVQPKGYFLLNDCLRFLELPGASTASTAPSAADAAVAPKDVKKQPAQAAIGTPVASSVASPAPKSKPVTPVAAAKKEKPTPASPVAKPVETPVSPIKIKSPVKVASPKAAAVPSPAPAAVAAPASPVKKAAPVEATATPKPSETKPATPASPAAKPAATPASPAVAKPTPAAPAKPAEPAAPKTWAALFSGAPAAPAAPVAAPKAAPAAAPKPTPASPAKAVPTTTTDAAAPAAAAATPAEATTPAPQEKEKKRFYSLYIRDVPPQTKEGDLRELFKSYGSIASVGVPAGRGIAFVDYREEESMRAALADNKEFKVHDKVIHVEERKDKERSGFRADTRGGRGGRGAPKSGRSGDRKDRDDGKERRVVDREAGGANANGKAPASTNGPRAPATGDRREKGGRRSGKEDGGRGSSTRAE